MMTTLSLNWDNGDIYFYRDLPGCFMMCHTKNSMFKMSVMVKATKKENIGICKVAEGNLHDY